MKILYFAPIYYSDMKQRPQQIADFLSEKHEIYYVEPTISFVRKLLKGGKSCAGEQVKIKNNLTVIRLNGYFTFHKSVEILDILGINNFWELLQLKKLIDECDIIWVGYSGWYTVVRHIKNKHIIFDKMDEEDMLISSKLLKMTLRRNKQRLIKIAHTFIVTCQKFYDDLKTVGKPIYLIPNAVSDSFMENIPKNEVSYEEIKRVKTIGYIGTISEWFDMDVINKLLTIDEEYEIVLVGRNCLPENENSRVRYLGIKENNELPKIMQKFDVCLYNFKKSDLLDTINPVKIYEYLAANKPVLAVKSAETVPLKKYLMIYDDVNDIESIMREKIKKPFLNEEERDRFVRENGWKTRTDEINKILNTME